MNRILTFLLALCMLAAMAVPVFAEDSCGEDMTWEYADGTLTVTGSGAMDDFENGGAPWEEHKDEIRRVVLSGSISYIGAYAFTDYDMLQTVNFGNSLYEIGEAAFKSCDGLTVIYLPASFKVFGESSFASCSGLTSIHCSGQFPKFRMNCLWNTYGTIYYPADKPWGVEYIEQLETAFKGRIEFLASDGKDHYQPEEVTVPATEPPTEPPTEAPTEAPTEVPTAAPTEAPTRPPETVPVQTEAETLPQTAPDTEAPAQPEPKPASKSWIGVVIIGTVAVFVLLGMIVVGLSNRKGRYSRGRKKRR